MMLARVLSGAYWGFVAVSAVAAFPGALAVWVITAPFDRRRVLLHVYTCAWASLYTWFSPVWSVRVRGRENIAPDRVYVMVANHLSVVDIFVLFRLFRHFKWVSKIENFKLPFIGWNMSLNRYIPIRRGNKESVVAMLDACKATLEAGSSVMMFPEGTRSKSGRLQRFKPGAFGLAKEAGVALLPIVIRGSHEALPKKGFVVRPAEISVTVLPEIPITTVTELSVEALTEHVHRVFEEFLGETEPERGATAT